MGRPAQLGAGGGIPGGPGSPGRSPPACGGAGGERERRRERRSAIFLPHHARGAEPLKSRASPAPACLLASSSSPAVPRRPPPLSPFLAGQGRAAAAFRQRLSRPRGASGRPAGEGGSAVRTLFPPGARRGRRAAAGSPTPQELGSRSRARGAAGRCVCGGGQGSAGASVSTGGGVVASEGGGGVVRQGRSGTALAAGGGKGKGAGGRGAAVASGSARLGPAG